MSMSTGNTRRPSSSTPTAKAKTAGGSAGRQATDKQPADSQQPTAGKPDGPVGGKLPPAKAPSRQRPGSGGKPSSTSRPFAAGTGTPAGKGGGKGRRPVAPVKVSQGRNWGPILMYVGAGLVAVLIIGFGAVEAYRQTHKPKWQDRVAKIEGVSNYLAANPEWFKYGPEGNHKTGPLSYPSSPPVGGVHNPNWQNCMGDVYAAEIPKEQAIHSLEHGAVWVAYRPDLPADQVSALAAKVDGKSFMLMSPYPGLDRPISLQAWGYQLKVDSAGDGRIDEFIGALRQNATQEPQAGCSGGITDTGTTPLDLPAAPAGGIPGGINGAGVGG